MTIKYFRLRGDSFAALARMPGLCNETEQLPTSQSGNNSSNPIFGRGINCANWDEDFHIFRPGHYTAQFA